MKATTSTPRTQREAARILDGSVLSFGDGQQIGAVKVVSLFEDASRCLSIFGFRITCFCCDGRGTYDCDNASCHRVHDCGSCRGRGSFEATTGLLERLTVEQLKTVVAEVNEVTEAVAA